MSQRLGDLLVKEKVISAEQLQQDQRFRRTPIAAWAMLLVKLGFLTDEDSPIFFPGVRRSCHQSLLFEIDPAVVKLIPSSRLQSAIRFFSEPRWGSLTIAMVDFPRTFSPWTISSS